jgi:hypothetical protein
LLPVSLFASCFVNPTVPFFRRSGASHIINPVFVNPC